MDENKKSGPRDISDLKARLGLKKPAGIPTSTPPAGQAASPLPSSFGAAATQPQGPPPPFGRASEPAPAPAPPPDPKRDPFANQQARAAAANLAAFYGVGQTLPGSADTVDAKPISKPKPWGRIIFFVAVFGVIFGIGDACGRIQRDRIEWNTTTDQAAVIRDEVDKMAKQLSTIVDTLNASPSGRKGEYDPVLADKLGGLNLVKPDTGKIFHTNYASLEPVIVERLMQYYNNSIKLYDLLTTHVKKTENDKDALVRMQKEGAKSDKNYGVIVKPANGLMLAEFVEVGQPVCNDPGKTDCNANELKGFQYRLDSGSGWGQRPVKGKPEMIVMPLQQTPLFKAVAAGNPDFLAVKDFARRMAEIRLLAGQVMQQQKDVVADLKRAAERPKMVAF